MGFSKVFIMQKTTVTIYPQSVTNYPTPGQLVTDAGLTQIVTSKDFIASTG